MRKMTELIGYLKVKGQLVISEMADSSKRALDRLIERGICRYEIVDKVRPNGHEYAEIVYTLE